MAKKNSEAAEDLKTYYKAMREGNCDLALLIERKYKVDGYSPEIVSIGLTALANGKSMFKAIDAATGF